MMAWFDFLRSPRAAAIETLEIPLFPLNTVLFPEGRLSLKLFEQRYLDMAAACLKDDSPFGVCLIASGSETGEAAQPHPVGTLARIGDWEMEQLGILLVTARGGLRFRILETHEGPGKLLTAKVELLAAREPVALPAERRRLLPLVRRIVEDQGAQRLPGPHRYDDAEWIGCRISEVLPVQNLAKQKLLELEDPLARLEVLEQYLDQRRLLD